MAAGTASQCPAFFIAIVIVIKKDDCENLKDCHMRLLKMRKHFHDSINVCYTDSVPEREYESLQEFSELFGGKVKERIILTRDTEGEENGIVYIPLWKWLLTRES